MKWDATRWAALTVIQYRVYALTVIQYRVYGIGYRV